MKHYDLVVIGGGPGGTPVAMEYAKLNPNKKIALIDKDGKLGGECLFQGCIPSKILEASAKYIQSLKKLSDFGIEIQPSYSLIWDKIKQRKEEILNKRNKAAEDVAIEFGVELIKSKAKFTSKNTIQLENEEISFSKAVIATGSHSFIPKYDGNGSDKIYTNSEFFAQMQLPKSISIIGSGAIAIEFAMILVELGVKVNIFARGDKILKNIDTEAREFIQNKLQINKNINLFLNSNITKVDFENNQFIITFSQNNQTKTITSEKMLSAAGRVANIDLDLEKAEVEYSKKGIKTNKYLQTTNPNIYANGDIVEGFAKFAHTAQYAAHTIAQNLFLEHNLFSVDLEKNSWVLFTTPNIMMAGINEKEAEKKGIEVIVDKFEFKTEAKSQIENEDYGYLKFIVNKKTNQILGISAMHEEAQFLGGEASLIVAKKLKLSDLIDSIHPHPTMSEAFVTLAKQMMGKIMEEKLKNPIIEGLLAIERWL